MKRIISLLFISIAIFTLSNSFASINTKSAYEISFFNEIDTLQSIRTEKIENAADIICNANNKIDEEYALELAEMIYDESELHNVSYSLLLAIIHTESRFNHNAKSWAGAKGIMQIMPMTFKGISKMYGYNYGEDEIYDLRANLRIGTIYLMRLQDKYSSVNLIAAGYNGGPGIANRYRKFLAGEDVKIPDETKKYVSQVSLLTNKYKKILVE